MCEIQEMVNIWVSGDTLVDPRSSSNDVPDAYNLCGLQYNIELEVIEESTKDGKRIQLEHHGAYVSKEDINQKFLRRPPPSWSQIELIIRNKPNIDKVDIDDLYNNLRVYEDELKVFSGDWVSTAGGINSKFSYTPNAHDIRLLLYLQNQQPFPQSENKDFQQMVREDLEELFFDGRVDMLTVQIIYALMAISSSKLNQVLLILRYKIVLNVRSSDEESTLAKNRFTKANEYHVVPPPITGNPLTPRADISFAGLDEYAFRNKIIESKTTKTNKTVGNTNEATITSNDEDDECAVKTVSSIKPNVTQAVRSQADKSGQTSQKQGIGSTKSPEPRVKNVVNTEERVVKLVWDYGKRVNHQNFSTNLKYPHAKRTFNPSAVLTRAGLVNTNRSNISTARSISTVRPLSTARPLASKITQSNSVIRPNHPRLDIVRLKAPNSPIKRSYFTQPVYRPKDLKPNMKTFGVKNMTTVRTRAVVSKGKVENVLKKAKWVWRPKMNYQDHVAIQRSCNKIMQWWIVVDLAI
ncbi:hypothetical protein Tco_0154032 [Tanacetum coccineum]